MCVSVRVRVLVCVGVSVCRGEKATDFLVNFEIFPINEQM